MKHKKDLIYIEHMLEMTEKAIEAIKSKKRKDYDGDEVLRMGLTHFVQVVGEAARNVSIQFQQEHPEIPWRQIIGMRHRIVHDYMRVDEDVLWEVVSNDLPALLPHLEKIIPKE